jgi:hypothetical protein
MTKQSFLLCLAIFIIGGLTGVLIRNSFIKPCEPLTIYVNPGGDSIKAVLKLKDDSLTVFKAKIQDLQTGYAILKSNSDVQKSILENRISNLNDSDRIKWFQKYCSDRGFNADAVKFNH